MRAMPDQDDYLARDDDALLRDCDVHLYKSSGPGGQHRNKVSSAVRLLHRPTGVVAHGDESRSQHENRRMALRRLRMNIACRVRRPAPGEGGRVPQVVRECLFTPRGPRRANAATKGLQRLEIGRKDFRFWRVAAYLLDLVAACEGRLAPAAARLGITTSNLVSVLKSDRHLLAAAQGIRKEHARGPIT